MKFRRLVIISMVAMPLITLAVLLLQGVQAAREAARQTSCRGRLCQLQLALMNYHDTYGCFPPAYVADADGRPMHSWRVLLLPFIEQRAVYEEYRFDEPWNSNHNRQLAGRIDRIYRCPGHDDVSDPNNTDYVVIVGAKTPFPGARTTRLSDMKDKDENTILVVEIANSDIPWMEPRDLDAEKMSYRVNATDAPSISAYHPLGPAVVFADRITPYRLDKSLRPETVRALTTIAGHEPVTKESLKLADVSQGGRLAEK